MRTTAIIQEFNEEYNIITIKLEEIFEHFLEKKGYGNLLHLYSDDREINIYYEKEYIEQIIRTNQEFWNDEEFWIK